MSWSVQMFREDAVGDRTSWNCVLGLDYHKLWESILYSKNDIIEILKTRLGGTMAERVH